MVDKEQIVEKPGAVLHRLQGLKRNLSSALKDLRCPPPRQNLFLDGLRSIAILLVVNMHCSSEFTAMHGDNFYSRLPFVVNGWIGVDLFFVLSGFFIGGQLWKELQATGTISVGWFILRRGLRIWPLYFFTFIAVFAIFWPSASGKAYGWADVTFLVNYFNAGIVLGGWSLSTEEQFYILAPTLLFLFARGHKPRTIWVSLWSLLALLPVLRAVVWIRHTGHLFSHDPALFATIYYPFHTHCDGLIMGLIVSYRWVSVDGAKSRHWISLALVPTSAFAMLSLRGFQHEIFDFSGLALFFGSIVWFGATSASVPVRPRVFYWISRLSFGMYLNHPYLVRPIVRWVLPHLRFFPPDSTAAQLLGMSLVVVMSAALALVTFCLVEHPFLELRKKLLERSHEAQSAGESIGAESCRRASLSRTCLSSVEMPDPSREQRHPFVQ
jgi:peptidoglycan/LPS O-acetylase OafA/YrhL